MTSSKIYKDSWLRRAPKMGTRALFLLTLISFNTLKAASESPDPVLRQRIQQSAMMGWQFFALSASSLPTPQKDRQNKASFSTVVLRIPGRR